MFQQEEKAAAVRRQFPVLARLAYLNAGTNGPIPAPVSRAITTTLKGQVRHGRVGKGAYKEYEKIAQRARNLAARLLNATPEEIALTHHTTEGINLVTLGMDWRPGDRVLTTDEEHHGLLLPLANLRRRQGVQVDFLKTADLLGDPAGTVARAWTPRTRLLAFSHVSFRTGTLYPAGALIAAAHRLGGLTLVDGAQSVGAIPVDVRELGADFYASPGQKWLCGPEGTGFFYVAKELLSSLQPSVIGYFSIREMAVDGDFVLRSEANRFEVGSIFLPSLAGLAAALEFFLDQVGSEWAFQRICQMATEAAKLLEEAGNQVLTPAARAGLVSFRLPGREPGDVVATLAKKRILIRSIDRPSCVRIALGYYNDCADVERLMAALKGG